MLPDHLKVNFTDKFGVFYFRLVGTTYYQVIRIINFASGKFFFVAIANVK